VGLQSIYDLGNTFRLDNGLGRTSPSSFPFFSFCFSFFSFLLPQDSNGEFSYEECLPRLAPDWVKSPRPLSLSHGRIFPKTLVYQSKFILAFPKISISIITTFQLDKPFYLAIGAAIAATTRMGSSIEWAPKISVVHDVLGNVGYTVANEHTIHDDLLSATRDIWEPCKRRHARCHIGRCDVRCSSMCARGRIRWGER
jgi:hypothetical protein